MTNFYNLDGIKTELTKEISKTETLLAAWEQVTFPTKKSGEPFATMSRNISGATYAAHEYTMQPGENGLRITKWDKINGYVSDEVDCYCLVKYLEDEKKIAKTVNYMPKQSHLEQVYRYDIEDIKEAVSNRINYLKDRIMALKAQFNIVDDCYNNFKKCYAKTIEELANDCKPAGSVGFSDGKNDIFYMILDTIKDRFPYC